MLIIIFSIQYYGVNRLQTKVNLLILFVIFVTRRKCVLHDLMIDYLRQLHSKNETPEEYRKFLHRILMQSYFQKCQEDLTSYPDDGYFYQYSVYHSIQAADTSITKQLMTDFNWMTSKLKYFQTVYNLYIDLQDYINYLKTTEQV